MRNIKLIILNSIISISSFFCENVVHSPQLENNTAFGDYFNEIIRSDCKNFFRSICRLPASEDYEYNKFDETNIYLVGLYVKKGDSNIIPFFASNKINNKKLLYCYDSNNTSNIHSFELSDLLYQNILYNFSYQKYETLTNIFMISSLIILIIIISNMIYILRKLIIKAKGSSIYKKCLEVLFQLLFHFSPFLLLFLSAKYNYHNMPSALNLFSSSIFFTYYILFCFIFNNKFYLFTSLKDENNKNITTITYQNVFNKKQVIKIDIENIKENLDIISFFGILFLFFLSFSCLFLYITICGMKINGSIIEYPYISSTCKYILRLLNKNNIFKLSLSSTNITLSESIFCFIYYMIFLFSINHLKTCYLIFHDKTNKKIILIKEKEQEIRKKKKK